MVYDLAPIIPFLTVEIWDASFAAALAVSGGIAPISLFLAAWRIHEVACDPPKREARLAGAASA